MIVSFLMFVAEEEPSCLTANTKDLPDKRVHPERGVENQRFDREKEGPQRM